MKKRVFGVLVALVMAFAGFNAVLFSNAFAEGEESATEETTGEVEANKNTTSISLTPVNRVFQLASDSVYDSDMTINNDGTGELDVEVFAAPYSYIYSAESDTYQLGFSNENNFTQISRWITFKNTEGAYEKTIRASIDPGTSKTIEFRITTPSNIPAGGQYAVIFARTLNGSVNSNGIKTEASPGMVVYGRSTEGEALTTPEISNMTIRQSVTENETTRNNINAYAKVKNAGNVDFSAIGKDCSCASDERKEKGGKFLHMFINFVIQTFAAAKVLLFFELCKKIVK